MTEHDPNTPSADGVDDLTRFLDEDFGTEEVDLFEFTSGEEDSPLTQLKTIVLGLDWEITDESLQDLADEIEHLRYLEQFEHDKVSQVYLQALDKIGNYILTEGAHAHHNSIKLLMSLYYDFEKIISSELITGAEITALLKADVRKFKILQYQIAQKHGATAPEAAAAASELPITEHKTLLDIHAAILEIDWEVTDEGLARMADQLQLLKEQFAGNRYIQIIVRGLDTLNKYIDEERARTHPEAFSLLHHFFEALETLVDDKELDEENTQKILINSVNRLNTLKALITQTPQELDEQAITPVPEEEEAVSEKPTAVTEEEVAEVAAEPEEEPSGKIEGVAGDLEAADELDVELPVDDSGEVAPALFDSGEDTGAAALEEEAPSEELAEKLDFFFGDEEEAPPPSPEEEEVAEAEVAVAAEPEEKPTEEIEGVAGDLEAADELDVELPVDDSGEVAPALADSGEEGGIAALEEEAPPEELAEKLDFFFGEEEESFEPEAVEEAVAQKKAEEEELAEAAQREKEEEEELLSVSPALTGEPEPEGFVAEAEEIETEPEVLEEKLDFFFDEDDTAKLEVDETEALIEEEETAETSEEVPEALFGEEEEIVAEPEVEVTEEALFEEEPAAEPEAEVTEEALFEEEDEEEVLLTPELAAVEEITEPDVEEPLEAVSTPEEYNAAIEKIRGEFQEREQTLMDEISSLKAEIESLKSQLL